MNLTDEQKQKVTAWIEQGLKLSDIQSRLVSECDVNLTYIETRLLVDDLKLTPKDEPEEEVKPAPQEEVGGLPPDEPSALLPDADAVLPQGGGVKLSVETLARPGTIVSGSVTFSDGKVATWYLDQTGRLGVVPEEQGYRPSPVDVQSFQVALDKELAKRGF